MPTNYGPPLQPTMTPNSQMNVQVSTVSTINDPVWANSTIQYDTGTTIGNEFTWGGTNLSSLANYNFSIPNSSITWTPATVNPWQNYAATIITLVQGQIIQVDGKDYSISIDGNGNISFVSIESKAPKVEVPYIFVDLDDMYWEEQRYE
jgi:hypothetical protein